MPQPERDRGPGIAARASADQQLASTPNTSDRTPAPARLSWNGHPGLSVGHDRYVRRRRGPEPAAIDAAGVAVLESELAELLGTAGPVTDAEAVALALADRYGPTWCRRLAAELRQVADDLLAERRTPWGGGGA